MRKAIEKLGLGDMKTTNDRLENVVKEPTLAGAFDGFTSRATLRLGPTLALASCLIAPGGNAFLWKGSAREEEIAQDADWRGDWEIVGVSTVGVGPNAVIRLIRKH